MARYNLYLMDPTRDPRVIRRIAAQTGVDAGVLRPHLLRPPFLILRECTLSQSIQARRDLERLGLGIKLERLAPERITGNTRHPLADRVAGTGEQDVEEIVLEEGEDLQELAVDEALPQEEPGERPRRRRWIPAVLLLAACLAAGWWITRSEGVPEEVRKQLDYAFQRLGSQLEMLEDSPDRPEVLQAFQQELQRVSREARARWKDLPNSFRSRLEELEARARTLSLRTAEEKEQDLSTARMDDFTEATSEGESGWNRLQQAFNSLQRPRTVRQVQDLFSLVRLGQTREESLLAFEERRRQLVEECRLAVENLRLRQLEASLRLKGAAILPDPGGARLLADLPDGSVLEVEQGSRLHRASIQNGQVVIEGLDALDPAIRFRLARLDQQPGTIRKLLERGLEWMDPAAWHATRPGSTLPRRGRLVRHQPDAQPSDLLRTRPLPEGVVLSSTGNFLDGAAPPDMPDAELRQLLARCARAYLACRQWPEVVEIRQGEKRYRLSGMDLWILSRELL